jgi:hypothetical protein
MLALHRQSSVLVGPMRQARHSTGEVYGAAALHALYMHILCLRSRFVNAPKRCSGPAGSLSSSGSESNVMSQ